MSRIHDALRRGRSARQPASGGRAVHPDAVLAALGYKSGQRRPNAGVVFSIVLFAIVAVGTWWWLPSALGTKPAPVSPKGLTHSEPPPVAKPAPVTPAVASPALSSAQPTRTTPPKPAPVTVTATPAPVVARRLNTNGPVQQKPTQTAPGQPPAKAEPVPPKPVPPSDTMAAAKADDFKLALYYQRTGDFELALVHYKAVLQRDEMNADAHNNVGNLYMSKALYEDAAREFRRVVAIEPTYVTAHVNLSAALYQLKRYDESAAEARAAIRLDGRNGDAYVNLALAQAAAGQASDARSSLTRALEVDTHNAAAHYNLALQYEKAGELALALDHYRAFLQYAGPEQSGYAADVRSRVQTLEHR